MTRITCFVGLLRRARTPVPLPLRVGPAGPEAHLNRASAGENGTEALALSMDYSRLDTLAEPAVVDAFRLHSALRDLTLNLPRLGRVRRIGLLLADTYEDYPPAFGYMFDAGFDGPGDPSFDAVPREGCALFLDAIRASRRAPADYATESGFTATHELGHVFNLWHVATPSFMARSRPAGPYGSDAFAFTPAHRTYLSHAESPFVCPGGSRWGDRGDLHVTDDAPFNRPATSRVRLRISLSQTEGWCFEPLQLSVSVSVSAHVAQATIPDVIDPGYDDFIVWIDAPDGTRRRYRSPQLYCAIGIRRTIRAGAPFTRDIPIFGQAGGYTFRAAGVHRVQCTLRLPGGRMARSNTVEVLIRPAVSGGPRDERLRALLTARASAHVLFYKNARRLWATRDTLVEAARRTRGTPTAANIQYALAHALRKWACGRSRHTRRRYQAQVRRLLDEALDTERLSVSRQRRAMELLDKVSSGEWT